MSSFVVKIDCPDIPDISIVEFIGQVITNITNQISALDTEINMASQGDFGQVKALSESVSGIKEKAEQTGKILEEILGDKNKLEIAIARLEGPGQTLLQLTKLVELVKALEEELKGDPQEVFGYFSGVAELLTDVRQHIKKFGAYSSTPQLTAVGKKVECIQDELERMVQWRVREIGPLLTADEDIDATAPQTDSARPQSSGTRSSKQATESQPPSGGREKSRSSEAAAANLQTLEQVSDLVDVLGLAFRKDLLVRFAQLQLLPYEKLFCVGMRYAALDCLERRYAWLRKLIKLADAKVSSVFPASWMLPVFFFTEFIRRTRNHLAEVLAAAPQNPTKPGSPEDTLQIARLLGSIRSVLGFEKEMMAQFTALARQSGGTLDGLVKESCSEGFDAFMGPWITAERSRLDELLERLHKEEVEGKSTAPLPGQGIEYNSSREMFAYIKASLGRCTEFSRGQTYLAMSREYRICLAKYAEKLRFRLPVPEIAKAGKSPTYDISSTQEYRLCRIVTTCVYTINTIPKLEEIMREAVKSEFQSAVHFNDEVDAFEEVLELTLGVINSGIVHRMDEAFKDMKKIDWTRIDSIGDDSKYVRHIKEVLTESVPKLRKNLPSERFLLACRKLSERVLDAIKDNIYKLKRIAKIGAEQLKMDLHGVKEFLLRLPTIKLPPDAEAIVVNKAYIATINARFTSIQNILKLVSAEDDNVVEIFNLLWPDGTQQELDAIYGLRAKQGGLIPSLPSAGVGKAAKELTSGMKSAFSDIMGAGGLFGSEDKKPNSGKAPQKAVNPAPKPRPNPNPSSNGSTSTSSGSSAAASKPPAKSSVPSGGAVGSAGASQRIIAFYTKSDPSKLDHIRGLLTGKYSGKEGELLQKVQQQYPSETI